MRLDGNEEDRLDSVSMPSERLYPYRWRRGAVVLAIQNPRFERIAS